MKIGVLLICIAIVLTGGIRIGTRRPHDDITPIKTADVYDEPAPTPEPTPDGIWLPDDEFEDDDCIGIDLPDDDTPEEYITNTMKPTTNDPTPTPRYTGPIELPDDFF